MMTIGALICDTATCTRPGCSIAEGCKRHAWRELAPERYRAQLERIVADADRDGLVLTVEQVSLQPLAMGNYETRVSVRPKRGPSSARSSGVTARTCAHAPSVPCWQSLQQPLQTMRW